MLFNNITWLVLTLFEQASVVLQNLTARLAQCLNCQKISGGVDIFAINSIFPCILALHKLHWECHRGCILIIFIHHTMVEKQNKQNNLTKF